MYTMILILPRLDEKVQISSIKNKIVAYAGTRLIEYNSPEMPGIVLNSELTPQDKETITKMAEGKCGVIFIEDENVNNMDNEYLTLNICK